MPSPPVHVPGLVPITVRRSTVVMRLPHLIRENRSPFTLSTPTHRHTSSSTIARLITRQRPTCKFTRHHRVNLRRLPLFHFVLTGRPGRRSGIGNVWLVFTLAVAVVVTVRYCRWKLLHSGRRDCPIRLGLISSALEIPPHALVVTQLLNTDAGHELILGGAEVFFGDLDCQIGGLGVMIEELGDGERWERGGGLSW